MARLAKFIVLGILLVLVVALGAGSVFLRSDAGLATVDSRTRPIVERLVADQLGSKITYDKLQGQLPGYIVLSGVTLADREGRWATIDEARLDWSALAALRGNIQVEEFGLKGVTLYRPIPPLPKAAETEKTRDKKGTIPTLSVNRLSLEKVTLMPAVLGQRYDLEAKGYGQYKNGRGELVAHLETAQKTDSLDVRLLYTDLRLEAKIDVSSSPDGLIATMTNAQGPVSLTVDGDGPLTAWAGTIEAHLGGYGELKAALTADATTGDKAEIAATLIPDRALDPRIAAFVGETLSVNGKVIKQGDDRLFELTDATGGFGQFTGTLTQSANEIALAVQGTLTPEPLAAVGAPPVAGPLSLTLLTTPATTTHKRTLATTLELAAGKVSVRDGFLTDDGAVRGTLSLLPSKEFFASSPLSPLLGPASHLSTKFDWSNEKTLRLEDLMLDLGPDAQTRLTVTGDAVLDTGQPQLKALAAIDMDAGIAPALGLGEIAAGKTKLRVDANGPFSNFTATITGDVAPLLIAGGTVAGSAVDFTIDGLPAAPKIAGTAAAIDKSYLATLEASVSDNQLLLSQFDIAAPAAHFTAKGALSRTDPVANLNARFDAQNGTRLPDGRTLSGSLSFDAKRTSDNQLTASAVIPSLQMGETKLGRSTLILNGPIDRLKTTLSVASLQAADFYFLDLDTAATISQPEGSTVINIERFQTFSEEVTDSQRIALTKPTSLTLGRQIQLAPTSLDLVAGGQLTAEGLMEQKRWVASLRGSRVKLPKMGLPADLNIDIDTERSELGTFTLSTDDPDHAASLSLDGQWTNKGLRLDGAFTGSGKKIASARLAMPLDLLWNQPGLRIDIPDGDIDGVISIDGPIDGITSLLPELPVSVGGPVNGQILLSGRPISPEIKGALAWADGQLEDQIIGLSAQNIAANVAFSLIDGDVTGTINGTAADVRGHDGAIKLSGEFSPASAGADKQVSATLTLNDAYLIQSPELSLQTDAELSLNGDMRKLLLAGDINIKELDAVLPKGGAGGSSAARFDPVIVNRIDAPAQTATPNKTESPLEVSLDLTIQANNRIFINGNGLTTEWATDLDIAGDIASPELDGTISIQNGRLTFAGRDFDISEGKIAFTPDKGLDPSLSLTAAHDNGQINAIINVTGSPSTPKISLSSSPERPQEDILALLLFGKPPTELSALETLQIANAVAQLSGLSPIGGGPGVSNSLRKSIGLDALSMDFDPKTGLGAVEVGKYISDEVYVTARQKPGETGTEVAVTYEVNDHITIESAVKPNGAQNVSANFKRDY